MDYIDMNELNEYIGIGVIPAEDAARYIHMASRHIDILTFNRINKYGFDRLTAFQKAIIKEATAYLAGFEYENEDVLKSALTSYSINGVSMNFGENWNVKIQNGVAIRADIYDLLSTTGLTTLNFYI